MDAVLAALCVDESVKLSVRRYELVELLPTCGVDVIKTSLVVLNSSVCWRYPVILNGLNYPQHSNKKRDCTGEPKELSADCPKNIYH